MPAEDLLFHGKLTRDGCRILEFPTYTIGKDGPYWNVLCSSYGNSGHLNSEAEALDWVRRYIKSYVRLSDYQTLRSENEELKRKLAEYEIDHTGD